MEKKQHKKEQTPVPLETNSEEIEKRRQEYWNRVQRIDVEEKELEAKETREKEFLPEIKRENLIDCILKKQSKTQLIAQFANYPLHAAFCQKQVHELAKEHGESTIINVIGVLLEDFSTSFNRDLEPTHIEEITAEILHSSLSTLSPESIFLCLREMKYQDHIGKMNINKVLKALNAVFVLQIEYHEQQNIQKHLQHKYGQDKRQLNENLFNEEFRQFKSKLLSNKNK